MDPNRTRIKSQPQTTAGPVGLFVGLAPLRHYIEFGQDADGVIAIVAASVPHYEFIDSLSFPSSTQTNRGLWKVSLLFSEGDGA